MIHYSILEGSGHSDAEREVVSGRLSRVFGKVPHDLALEAREREIRTVRERVGQGRHNRKCCVRRRRQSGQSFESCSGSDKLSRFVGPG